MTPFLLALPSSPPHPASDPHASTDCSGLTDCTCPSPADIMAFNNGFGDRIDDIRFRHPQSPRDESYSGYNSPRRVNGGYMTTHSQSSSNDTRASLQRRFTTDSSILPTLTPIGQQPGQVGEAMDLSSTVSYTPPAVLYSRRSTLSSS